LLVRVSFETGDPMDGDVIYDGPIGDVPGERTGNSCCGEDAMKAALAGLCVFEYAQ
jgi:hypothetical protein